MTDLETVKAIQLNTWHTGREGGLFNEILDRFYTEKPDIVLLQEVFEGSLEQIRNAIGGQVVFSRLCRFSLTDREVDAEPWGIAIASKWPISDVKEDYYHGSRETSNTVFLNGRGLVDAHSLLQASVERGSVRFNLATTYFTWVRGADPSKEQLEDFKRLAVLLDQTQDIILTGDFNSPRGYPIYDSLAKRYRDNVPLEVDTTLDPGVRPEHTWQYVVDGFFTSEHYRVENVRMVQGLSDHKGILGEVQKTF